MKSLIKLGLILVAGILVYNYFFGSETEKAQSREIFEKVGDLGRAGINLLKSEKEKFDEGKYDDALDKIGNLFDKVRNKAEDIGDSELLRDVSRLEEKRKELQERVDRNAPQGYSNEEKDSLREEWKILMEESEEVMRKLDDQ
jgi:restriction endonuclease